MVLLVGAGLMRPPEKIYHTDGGFVGCDDRGAPEFCIFNTAIKEPSLDCHKAQNAFAVKSEK